MFQAFLFCMRITTVSYQKLFPLAPYENEKIELTASIDDTESPDKVLSELKKIAVQWHTANNPQVYSEALMQPVTPHTNIGLPSIQVEKTPEEIRIGVMVKDIESCTDLKVLKSYQLLVSKSPELSEAYNKKYKELSKQ